MASEVQRHQAELEAGERFDFGANWQRFLRDLTDPQVERARAALIELLGTDVRGKRFLDAGSGSGLSSLAAFSAGATVTSFDYDPECVNATSALQKRAAASGDRWRVLSGSVLADDFVEGLGKFDIVYSWGVLHHTGAMWDACQRIASCVAPGGLLAVALYNDQGWQSRYWTRVKRFYNRSSAAAAAMLAFHLPYFVAARVVGNTVRMLTGVRREERGMRFWPDVVDWVGGYPFEVASRDEVERYFCSQGFETVKVVSVGRRSGCNEFVFRRTPSAG